MSDANFQAARHLVALNRPQEALRKLGENFDPEDAWDWWLRALALLQMDRGSEAIDAAQRGLAVDPEMPDLLWIVARARMEQNDLVRAEEAILAALRLDAEDPDNLALYALIVARAGQIEKARKLIDRARGIDPENARALRIQSVIELAAGNDREALLRSRELLALDPEDVQAHHVAGSVLQERGDFDRADSHLRSAVVIDPARHDIADAARENILWRHPLMWPLRPVQRFGIAPVWITGVGILYASKFGPEWLSWTAVWTWVTYCVYSWVVPPVLRRFMR